MGRGPKAVTTRPRVESGRARPDSSTSGRPILVRWAWLLIVVAGAATYSSGLHAPFIFDDTGVIEDNPFLTRLWPLTDAMRAPVQSAFSGRPVVSLSFAVSYALAGGLSPAGFRAWNVAVVIASALVLFGVVARTLRRRRHASATPSGWTDEGTALTIALLWLLHPLNTEVVGYVTQRTEAMMGLFYLATLYAAMRVMEDQRPPLPWTIVAVGMCALGMASKESMVTAPVMVLLYDVVFVAGSPREALARRRLLYGGLFATWLLLLGLNLTTPRFRSAGFSAGVSVWAYLLNQAAMIGTYFKLTFWPHPLLIDYGRTHPIAAITVLPSLLLVVALVAAVAAAWIRLRPVAYLGTWFFVTLAPSSSIVPIATEVGAERRMYLALAAVVALVVLAGRWGIQRLTRDSPPSRGRLAWGMVTTLAIVCAALTSSRLRAYEDPQRLWAQVLSERPHGRAHYNAAIEAKKRGRTGEALEHYRAALPDEPGAHYAIGFELGSANQHEAAVAEFREFLRLLPGDVLAPKATFLLGQSLARISKPAEAEQAFRETLRMIPGDADARGALADLFSSTARHADAIPIYREYLTMIPTNAVAHHNLGVALIATEQEAEAVKAFERAVVLNPSEPGFRLSLGNALAAVGRLDDAIAQYRAGLRMDARNARVMSALALTLAVNGELDEPLALFRRARELEPNSPEIESDYRMALERWKQH